MNQQPNNEYESYLRSLRLNLLQKINIESDHIYVLDIGCNDGSMWFNHKNSMIIDGVDIDDQALIYAGTSGVYRELHHTNIPDISNYDIVMCCGVLEHVEDYWTFSEGFQRAKSVVMTVPNGWSFHRIMGYYMGLLNQPEDLHDGDLSIGHKRVFTPDTWRDFITIFANDGGFHQIECGSIGLKTLSSGQMIELPHDAWQAFDETGEDLMLCGNNCYYGAELYAILERD